MPKEKKDAKKDKKNKNNGAPVTSFEPDPALAKVAGTYTDGTPLDKVTYLEAKLILKPDRFTSVQSFRDFGKIVKATAKKVGVGFIPDARHRSSSRNPRDHLHGHSGFSAVQQRLHSAAAHCIRRRLSGGRSGDCFQVPASRRAAGHADGCAPEDRGQISNQVQGRGAAVEGRGGRLSHSLLAQLPVRLEPGPRCRTRAQWRRWRRCLPALASVKKSDEEHVCLVNEGIVEEVLLPLGQLDFGKGQVANCDVALWRTRGEHKPLVGEFAFQVKFPSREAVADKSKKLAEQFYISLQYDVESWLALGVTKTAMVYRLKGNEPQSHE